jgi:hypothetical protein
MPKRRSIKRTQTANISHNVIAYKLDEIKEIVNRNSKDIEDLKNKWLWVQVVLKLYL